VDEAWEAGLAATKLRPPVPPAGLVQRSRIDRVLDGAIDQAVRLILVSAPAGSGKSTLLSTWLAGRPEGTAWLQVEVSDSDPVRFWSYLAAALAQCSSLPVAEIQAVARSSDGDAQVVVSALVNALEAAGEPLVVVVDDYHLIESARVHEGVERLVDLCPAQVTVVLASRIDPPFRLGRLRVRGRLAEVRAADLRFAPDEAAGLLGPAGRSLPPPLLDDLCERTEGWAAGLVLAGLSLHRAEDAATFIDGFRGDDQLVVDYLRDELLAGLAPDDRRRLVESSILEQLSGDLIDAVSATGGGATWLRDTAAANQLLIGLERTGTWFRYHHLLRDLLRLEAQEALPERLPELHGRAARWFEAHGDVHQAVVHRLAAGDTQAVVRLLHGYGPILLHTGQVETLRGLLDQLGDIVGTSPGCSLLAGWCDYLGGRYSMAERRLDEALALAPADFDRVIAMPLRINISLARGDVTSAVAVAVEIGTPELMAAHRADLSTAVAAAHAWAGQAQTARPALRVALERAASEDSRSGAVLGRVHLAIVEQEAGTPAAAAAAAEAALATAQRFGLSGYHGIASAHAIRARTATDPAEARDGALEAVALARRASTDLTLGYVLAMCGDTLLDLGDPAGAALLAESGEVLDRCRDPGIAGRYLARARSRHELASTGPEPVAALVEQLTDRELAVLRYLPSGLSQRDIAGELYVSLNTVKTHCRAIYRKLGVTDRQAAVQAARDLHVG
jgi:LuxR family maltose regulon positive regulatory protein